MRVIIIHGWGANSQSNWFPWLKNQLENKAVEVIVPDFPKTENPIQEEWVEFLNTLQIDKDTILVGHSLGCITILRYLEQSKQTIRAAFLVAGFAQPLGIPEIENFFKTEVDFPHIKTKTPTIVAINSDNDHYIDLSIAQQLEQKLGAQLIILHNHEHIMQPELPIISEKIEEMIN